MDPKSLYRAFFPILLFVFRCLGYLNAKVKEGLKERQDSPWLAPFHSSPKSWIWFHVSSGELEYAKSLLRSLKARGKHRILVTYFSPSVRGSLNKTPEIDLFVPMPWDRPEDWTAFLNHFKPVLLAIARTDVWPEMIWSTHELKIPIVLFSATLTAESGKMKSFITRWFYQNVFKDITHVSAVSSDDQACFQRLVPMGSISVDGDTRFDQVFFRLNEKRPLKAFIKNDGATFVAGSTWPEDEKVLLPGLLSPIRKGLRVIIAPHEPTETHLKPLEDFFQKNYIDTVRYSKTDEWKERTVLLIDQVGILADIYPIASVAFVGGSFKKTIHSVMEPAGCGCLVLMGPYHNNNREALLLKNQGKALVINDERHLSDFLTLELATVDNVKNKRKESIIALTKSCQGATAAVESKIFELIS